MLHTFVFCLCLPWSTVACAYVTGKLTSSRQNDFSLVTWQIRQPISILPEATGLLKCVWVSKMVFDLNLNLKYRPHYDFHYLINYSWVRQTEWLRCSASTQQGRLGLNLIFTRFFLSLHQVLALAPPLSLFCSVFAVSLQNVLFTKRKCVRVPGGHFPQLPQTYSLLRLESKTEKEREREADVERDWKRKSGYVQQRAIDDS